MKRLLVICLIGIFAMPLVAADATSAVKRVLEGNAAAFARNDFDAVDKLWSHDESVTVFENGHANYGWADYRDRHLKPEMAELKNVKYELSDMKIHITGSTAWATFKYSISGDLKDRHVDGEGLGTAVLEKKSNDWKIVHWHSSAPRKKAADAPAPR